MTRQEFVSLYVFKHLTLQEIADQFGISRQSVGWWKKRYGVYSEDGEWVTYKCDTCRGEHRMTRARFKSSLKHFCCHSCHMDYLRSDEYKQRLVGKRIARNAVR